MCPPKRKSQPPWSKQRRRGLARVCQIVATVYDNIHHTVGLDRERPHDLTGLQARLAAKMALHDCCIWFNEQVGRPSLAFADLVDWQHGTISHQALDNATAAELTSVIDSLDECCGRDNITVAYRF